MARRAAKVDINQREIVSALRAVGAFVQSLAAVGAGVPDLMVGFRGETHLLEVKSRLAKRANGGRTDAQVAWHSLWRGRPVVIVRTVDEALNAIGVKSYTQLHQQIIPEARNCLGHNHLKEK